MSHTSFERSAGVSNTLRVPRAIRDYINEQGEGRSFNLDSFSAQLSEQPRQVSVEFRITPTGAEQLEPFTVNLILGESAARQLAEALKMAPGNNLEG